MKQPEQNSRENSRADHPVPLFQILKEKAPENNLLAEGADNPNQKNHLPHGSVDNCAAHLFHRILRKIQ